MVGTPNGPLAPHFSRCQASTRTLPSSPVGLRRATGPPERSLWSEYPLAARRTTTPPPRPRLKASIRSSIGSGAYVNELRPTLLTNVGSPWLQWLLITDAARPSQPARPFGAVQKAARRPCRVANTLIMRQRLAWPGCV